MPVVDVDPEELRRLTGREDKSDEELKKDLFALGLEYEGETDDGEMQLEFGPDRLDRLSVEGVARSLRYQYGDDRGVYVPKTNDPDWTIEVAESVPDERPYVTGAVIRGVNLDETALDSLIQLQEKLHATMGRKRVKGAVGIHDLTMLKGEVLTGASEASDTPENGSRPRPRTGGNSVVYRGIDPDADRFVPLDSNRGLTPGEVLTEHPTGRTYAEVVAEYERMPAIYDELGLFSFPPVINGRRTEVSTDSRDLFVELTGTDQWTIDRMCNIVCYALDARGATVESVEVVYPEGTSESGESEARRTPSGGVLRRPDFEVETKSVSHARIESLLGVDLDAAAVVDLFERSGLDAAVADGEAAAATDRSGDKPAEPAESTIYEVSVPPYRVDVLHPLDLVDDIGRAYGFNDLEPRYPDVSTVGGRHVRSRLERAVRASLVGLGFEDLLDFHLISEDDNYDRMRIDRPADASGDAPVLGAAAPVSITEPYSEEYGMVRTWALPSLLTVLENNTHRSYPQDLAEIGLAVHRDDAEPTRVAERRTVAAVIARHDATYEDAKARLSALCGDFDVSIETPAAEHPSFIPGRAAAIVVDGEDVGVVGEIHPEVLVEHDLELPVAAFEFRLDALGE